MKILKILFLSLLFYCNSALADDDLIQIESFVKSKDNQNTELLLEFKIKKDWHLFAPIEQDFGSPLEIKWIIPQDIGFKVWEENFSRPKQFDLEGLKFYAYEDKAYYKATIFNPNHVPLKLDVNWQVCLEECIKGKTRVDAPIVESFDFAKIEEQANSSFKEAQKEASNSLWIILSAFLGGMILNLMPCIFPILSLKIMSLAKMEKKHRFYEALFYSLGVIGSMLVLAIILWIMKANGASVSWGFQLQSPYFIGFMIILFIILSLMMLGVFEFGGIFSRLGNIKFINAKVNAFMTGFLAVLIASPCTAPFMGAAIAYAIMAPKEIYFTIFSALGIGYALPFAMIALFPNAIKKIMPKSGKWMLRLKQILSIPLILTVVWLSLVLKEQMYNQKNIDIVWQDYNEEKINLAIEQKRPVFIDFTAKWCITCLANKKISLDTKEFYEIVKQKNILLFRADMTNSDKKIEAGLRKYGRVGVPLYVYYDGKSDKPEILPQILTIGIIKDYIK